MKETIFSHYRVCILLGLSGIFLINILPFTCLGIEKASAEPVFSVNSTDEPLYKVLAKISKSTGYKIEMKNGLSNKLLTANLNKFTLREGIREIFRIIEEPNYAIVIDDRMKKVEIRVFNASSGNSYVGTNNPAKYRQRQNEGAGIDAGANPNFFVKEVTPPPPLP